jgi:hypothetical protein
MSGVVGMSWAEDELKNTDLGDRRREQRLLTIVAANNAC